MRKPPACAVRKVWWVGAVCRHTSTPRHASRDQRLQNDGRLVDQRLLISEQHFVTHRGRERFGVMLATAAQSCQLVQYILRHRLTLLVNPEFACRKIRFGRVADDIARDLSDLGFKLFACRVNAPKAKTAEPL